ncbi:MAG TPA: permease prefix domain 1-containing protein [Verrucomicrobiae bacterium]|jgi:hypothetical protein
MENQTRFDLNAAVENWRNELAAQPNLASDDRRELETHLRDAIAGFQQRGLNDEESFWLARKRVGQPQPLGEEFEKANPAKVWRERVFWMVTAILAAFLLTATSTSLAVVFVSCFPSVEKITNETTLNILFWILQIIGILRLILNGGMNRQFSMLASLLQNRLRLGITAICIVLTVEIFCAAILFWAYVAHDGPYSPMGPFWFIGNHVSNSLIRDLSLVSILIWLAPTQNRKTPKRA